MTNEAFTSSPGSSGEALRSAWNRRFQDDYRFWSGDGVDDDNAMWETGRRDFALLCANVPLSTSKEQTVLELGCGVGRILRAALEQGYRAVGVDISDKALEKASQFLVQWSNRLTLVQSKSSTMAEVPASSIDFAFSFATLAHMPIGDVAINLCELGRVVKARGTIALQTYLGAEHLAPREDTLAIRSLDFQRLKTALEHAGFSGVTAEELRLPFPVEDAELGSTAYIIRAERSPAVVEHNPAVIASLLTAVPEPSESTDYQGSVTEYHMALSRAHVYMEAGRIAEARRSLQYAIDCFAGAEDSVRELLENLKQFPENIVPPAPSGSALVNETPSVDSLETYPAPTLSVKERQRDRLDQKFRGLFDCRNAASRGGSPLSAVRARNGSPIIALGDHLLDNPHRPEEAAQSWVDRSFTPERQGAGALIVIGFASGYHLQALRKRFSGYLCVVEPRPEVVLEALGLRPEAPLLELVDAVCTTADEVSCFLRERAGIGDTELLIYPQYLPLYPELTGQLRKAIQGNRGVSTLTPSIAVVGPLYGGSLPIAGYVSRALQSLKQRVRPIDFSDFYGGYAKLKDYFRDEKRVATLQSHYVEMLSQVVLEAAAERTIDILICVAQAPISPRALTALRNQGVVTVMWFMEDCHRFDSWKSLSPFFDYMFLIQKGDWLREVKAAGAGAVHYLPVGCDPDIHCPVAMDEAERARWGSLVSFVGAGYNNRRQMLASLADLDFKIWGTEWPATPPFTWLVQEGGRRISPAEYVRIFNASAINLNLHSSMERDGVEPNGDFVNPRTFELASAGAFQLIDERTLLPDLFTAGEELITFRDRAEMRDQITYYASRPEERARITAKARGRALSQHTYAHRIDEMLRVVYADRYEHLRARVGSGPWQKTLKAAEAYPGLHQRLEKVFRRGEEPTIDGLIADIQQGKGSLCLDEQKLLFLHHVMAHITNISSQREGK